MPLCPRLLSAHGSMGTRAKTAPMCLATKDVRLALLRHPCSRRVVGTAIRCVVTIEKMAPTSEAILDVDNAASVRPRSTTKLRGLTPAWSPTAATQPRLMPSR